MDIGVICQRYGLLVYKFTIYILNSQRKMFVYQKSLLRIFHTGFWLQNNLCEFTAAGHKFKRWFVLDLKVRFKDFWFTEINLTQIWHAEFNKWITNSLHTQHEFLKLDYY